MFNDSNYDQFDADHEEQEAKERKSEISSRANRAAMMRRRRGLTPQIIYVGIGSSLERMGRVRLTRRFRS